MTTDITTSDDNCVDGFTGDAECMSGIFDDDSNTRHWFFENNRNGHNTSKKIGYNKTENEAVQELDSELSECDGIYPNKEPSSNSNNKVKRRKRVMLKNEDLSLQCEWMNCEFEVSSMERFVNHVSQHIAQLSVSEIDDGTEQYTCLWKSCDFNTTIVEEAKRHVNYHSYHTKLKSIGTNIKARIDLPECLYGNNSNANQIPDVLDPYKCNWSDCTYEGSCLQTFLFHVMAHVLACGNHCKCQWKGCGNNFANRNKLNCHVRIHTKEKLVACPDCGGMFASNTKFIDHCKRQLPADLQGYQCAHCFKQYSSERILRDHMCSHINVHKCIYCDMTCANKFTLAAHIRFRHLRLRPFNCTSCSYRCETKQDLVYHLGTHDNKNRLSCQEANCNFTCKSRQALRKHVYQEHEGVSFARIYECHECSKQFSRGVQLTYHLKSRHNLHWPSGHKRFSYRPDEDGKYKLQRIRYESLDVTEQMISSNDINMSDEEDLIENEGDVRSRDGENSKEVLITIDEENESGKKVMITIYSSVEPIDSLPDGATVLAECSND